MIAKLVFGELLEQVSGQVQDNADDLYFDPSEGSKKLGNIEERLSQIEKELNNSLTEKDLRGLQSELLSYQEKADRKSDRAILKGRRERRKEVKEQIDTLKRRVDEKLVFTAVNNNISDKQVEDLLSGRTTLNQLASDAGSSIGQPGNPFRTNNFDASRAGGQELLANPSVDAMSKSGVTGAIGAGMEKAGYGERNQRNVVTLTKVLVAMLIIKTRWDKTDGFGEKLFWGLAAYGLLSDNMLGGWSMFWNGRHNKNFSNTDALTMIAGAGGADLTEYQALQNKINKGRSLGQPLLSLFRNKPLLRSYLTYDPASGVASLDAKKFLTDYQLLDAKGGVNSEYFNLVDGSIKVTEKMQRDLFIDEKDEANKGFIGLMVKLYEDQTKGGQQLQGYNQGLSSFLSGIKFDFATYEAAPITSVYIDNQIQQVYKGKLDELKAAQEKKVADLASKLPKGYKIKPGEEGNVYAILNNLEHKDKWQMYSAEKLFILLEGHLVYDVYAASGVAPEALIASTTNAIDTGFGVAWSPEAKTDFAKSYLQVKSEAMTLHPGVDAHISVESVGGKNVMFFHAYGIQIRLDVANPNSMTVASTTVQGPRTSSMEQLLRMADATCFLIANFAATNYSATQTKNKNGDIITSQANNSPWVVGASTNVIEFAGGGQSTRGWIMEGFGQQDRQQKISAVGLDAGKVNLYADFLNGLMVTRKKQGNKTEVINIRKAGNVIGREYLSPYRNGVRFEITDEMYTGMTAVKPTKENLESSNKTVQSYIVDGIHWTVETVEESGKLIIEGAGGLVTAAWKDIADPLIIQITTTAGNVITQTIDGPIKRGILAFAKMTQPVLKSLVSAFNAVKGPLNELLGGLPKKILELSIDVVGGISQMAKAIGEKAPDLVTKVTEILGGLGDAISNATSDGELGMTEIAAIAALLYFFK